MLHRVCGCTVAEFASGPVAITALTMEEETAAAECDRMGKENEIERTTKDQDAAYKVNRRWVTRTTIFP